MSFKYVKDVEAEFLVSTCQEALDRQLKLELKQSHDIGYFEINVSTNNKEKLVSFVEDIMNDNIERIKEV